MFEKFKSLSLIFVLSVKSNSNAREKPLMFSLRLFISNVAAGARASTPLIIEGLSYASPFSYEMT